LTSIVIPDSVTSIGVYAFYECANLTSATIGTGVTNLSSYAFAHCPRLTSVLFLGDAPAADSTVFYDSPNVTIHYLPANTGWSSPFAGVSAVVPVIGSPVITTPVNGQVWSTGAGTVAGTASDFVSLAGVWFQVNSGGWQQAATTNHWTNWTATVANLVGGTNVLHAYAEDDLGDASAIASVSFIYLAPFNYTNLNGALTITRYTGSGGAVSIPGWINGVPATAIADYLFFNNRSLTSIVIPTNIISLGINSFAACSSLTNVTLPNGLTTIGTAAFSYCPGLTGITLPNTVTNLGDDAFMFCTGLTSITLPNSFTSLGSYVFNHCTSLTNVTLPNCLASLGDYAFAFCSSLATITLPGSITNLGAYALAGCSALNGIYFQGSAPVADVSAFYNTSATAYYLPGTTNWDSTFDGLTTLPWLPQMQSSAGNFGTPANQFGFTIAWASSQTVVVEACTNLSNPVWQPVQTNTLTTGAAGFSDPQWTNHPARFYRLRSP
jgi:hypothetical protein